MNKWRKLVEIVKKLVILKFTKGQQCRDLMFSLMLAEQDKLLNKHPSCWWYSCDIKYNVRRFDCECISIGCGSNQINTLAPERELQWRHNGCNSVSNHQPHDCLLNRLFRRRSKKTSKLRVTGLCAGNSPGTGKFPAQMASYAENVSIWWRHHVQI